MPSFLTFVLAAPLAAFGGVAVGERRASENRPAKSAVLGIIAAALGIERSENNAHAALAREFLFAVRTEDAGRRPRELMVDYHTTQSLPRGQKVNPTRRDELADKQRLGTILSRREYRSDCSFSIALWGRVSAGLFPLEDIARALKCPVFVPYAGRKACPLMLPMHPIVLEAADVREAFVRRDAMCAAQAGFLRSLGLAATPSSLACDVDPSGPQAGYGRRERRRDEVLNRTRWEFALREEVVGPWEGDTK